MKCLSCNIDLSWRYSIKAVEADRPIYYSYQWWECKKCGEKYYGILEESKVNIFNDDLIHTGYRVKPADWEESLQWAKKCPEPDIDSCNCAIHKELPPAGFYGEQAWYTY